VVTYNYTNEEKKLKFSLHMGHFNMGCMPKINVSCNTATCEQIGVALKDLQAASSCHSFEPTAGFMSRFLSLWAVSRKWLSATGVLKPGLPTDVDLAQ
jgi:hypothetical protein